jgi:hypothetical protein
MYCRQWACVVSKSLFHSIVLKELYADVRLESGKHRLAAHRFVLADRSEYFRALLLGSMREASRDVVQLVLPTQYDNDNDDDEISNNNDTNNNNDDDDKMPVSFLSLKVVVDFIYTRQLHFDLYCDEDDHLRASMVMCVFEVNTIVRESGYVDMCIYDNK